MKRQARNEGKIAIATDRDPMLRTARVMLAVAVAAAVATIVATLPLLPPSVPSHFDALGRADVFMPRAAYAFALLLLALPLPLAVAFGVARSHAAGRKSRVLPRRPRRTADPVSLAAFGGWLGAGVAFGVTVAHLLLLAASRAEPPRLESGAWVALWVIGLCGIAGWVALLRTRFERRPE